MTDATLAETPKTDLGLFAEISARLERVEKDNADLRAQISAARDSGVVEPYKGFGAHVVHVMTKHFFHDRPDPEKAAAE